MQSLVHRGLVPVILVLLLGCQVKKGEPPATQGQAATASNKQQGQEDQSTVKLPELVVEVGDEQDLAALLKENIGKVVLVEFWGTWCVPCRELLPHTMKMLEEFGSEGLVVISVAIEDMSNPSKIAEVKSVLVQNGGEKARALVSRYGISQESFEKFGIESGALPHLKLYGRDGKLAVTFGVDAEKPEPAQIEAAVKRLLAETSVSEDHTPSGPELTIPQSEAATANGPSAG